MIECACAKCDHRVVGCHATCEDYKEFVRQRNEKRENLYKLKVEQRLGYRIVNSKKRKK